MHHLGIAVAIVATLLCSTGAVALINYEFDKQSDYVAPSDDGMRMAPGTTLTYSVETSTNGVDYSGTSTYAVLAQNPSGMLYELVYDVRDSDGNLYPAPEKYQLTNDLDTEVLNSGTKVVNTIDGRLKLNFIEYESGNTMYRDYYNPYSEIMYFSESSDLSSVVKLIQKDVKWQGVGEYAPSDDLGTTLTFDMTGTVDGNTVSGTYVCQIVGDGIAGVALKHIYSVDRHLTVMYSYVPDSTWVAESGTVEADTVDGHKILHVFPFTDEDITYTYYFDESGGICYRMTATGDSINLSMELKSHESVDFWELQV